MVQNLEPYKYMFLYPSAFFSRDNELRKWILFYSDINPYCKNYALQVVSQSLLLSVRFKPLIISRECRLSIETIKLVVIHKLYIVERDTKYV